jgi:DNA gyrase/topoisomerase IV subunit B
MRQRRLTVKVDPFTFGGIKASKILAEILNEKYPHSVERVGCYYNKYTRDLKGFLNAWQIIPRGTLLDVMSMHRTKHLNKIADSKLPEEVKRFLQNVMQKEYKETLIKIRSLFDSNPE